MVALMQCVETSHRPHRSWPGPYWQYRNQSAAAAGRDEKFLFSLPSRFHRVVRIYHYQWQGTRPSPQTGWDSGLLYPNGTPRPAYYVLAQAAGKRP